MRINLILQQKPAHPLYYRERTMAKKKVIEVVKDSAGYLTCDSPLSTTQWLEIIQDRSVTSKRVRRVLMCLYFMPNHEASYQQCAERYGMFPQTYHSFISTYAKSIINSLGNIKIIDTKGNECYWPLVVNKLETKNSDDKNHSVVQLRSELVKALEELVIKDAIKSYIKDFEFYFDTERDGVSYNEKYKWQAVKWFQDNWDINASKFSTMLDNALSKTENLLVSRNSFPRGMIVSLAHTDPTAVRDMFKNLYDESLPLKDRVESFMRSADRLKEKYSNGEWNMHYQNTNTISIYLWLRFPDKYYIYKYGESKEVDEKLGLGFTFKRNGEPSEMIKGYEMYGILNSFLIQNKEARKIIEAHITKDPTCYPDPDLKTATIDLGYYISRRYKSLKSSLYSNKNSSMNPFISEAKSILENKKNVILQGAPGTGKTYNTAALALSVLGYNDVDFNNHFEVMKLYDSLIGSQIFFTTFHQSLDYEDFVEGIKPHIQTDEEGNPTGTVTYEAEDGIFKKACASVNTDEEDDISDWIDDFISQIKGIENKMEIPTITGKSSFYAWWNDGNKTISTRSKSSFDQTGATTASAPLNIKQVKEQALGKGSESNWPHYAQALIEFVKHKYSKKEEKPIVLIIDEINRGNVSKIFGELITLIEKDKRLGEDHPIRVTLPYSKTIFGVPSNLYIIGTMNTTDRSTGTIDYALRRRFAFITVPSQKEIIENERGKALFDDVRKFIETHRFAEMDIEDLMVGHSYFMAEDDDELLLKVKYEIIPLVKEYIKDGILRAGHEEQNKYFNAWLKLEPANDNDSGAQED